MIWLLLALSSALDWGSAHARPQRVDAVEVELIADRAAVVAGQSLQLGLRIRHDPHWHTYWRNPGDSGLPTQLDLTLPEGFFAGAIRWPAPQRLAVGPLMNFGYEGEIVLPVPLTVPARLDQRELSFSGHAQWLVCKDVCIPGEARLQLTLPVAAADARLAEAPRLSLFDAMAARTPARVLAAQGALAGSNLSMGFSGAGVRTAEFYPYADSLIENPAAQELYRDGDTARLQVRVAPKVDEARLKAAGFFDGPAGLMIVDGVPHEVSVQPVAALAQGQWISRIAAAGAVRPAGAGAEGGIRWPSAAGRSGSSPGEAASAASGAGEWPASAPASLGLALSFALLGGLVLNLMPCVFPVIGLKVLAFAGSSRGDPRAGRLNALVFAAGVLVSFWGLAALLAALRAAGESVGWGFQLQSSWFVTAMALLFVAIGLNLSGLFEFGLTATRLQADAAPGRQRPLSTFASGVLAVLVATPCTAPFMGSALGFTLGQPPAEAAAVFTALGLGMALPYLVLGWFPALLRWLPRPGRWMQTLRQALAFPMYATAAWLAWVLGVQMGLDAVFALSLGVVLLAVAAWCYGRFVQEGRAGSHRFAGALSALLALAAALWMAWPGASPQASSAAPAGSASAPSLSLPSASSSSATSPSSASASVSSSDWVAWSDQAVAQGRAEGRPVFVDFTAAWCVSCQANKKLVLERESVVQAMNRQRVLRLRADWTRRDPAIGAALARHGRNGVPLYLVYLPGNDAPVILPELLTTGTVLRVLDGGRDSAAIDRTASRAPGIVK